MTGRYLEHKTRVRVRFHEVDALHIVWHGHYVTYFEDARVALGKAYGIDYLDIHQAGLIAPVVHITCDYLQPAGYDDELDVTARLFERESAKIEFEFEARRVSDHVLVAVGRSVQAFMNLERELLMTLPDFMRAFYDRWRDRMVESDA
jgi:acyl-CoA thioester hydrolase